MMTFGQRVAYAFRCFFTLIVRGTIAADILEAVGAPALGPAGAPARPRAEPRPAAVSPAGPLPPPPEDRGDRAVQLLALLQRDGRLVDFLREDVGAYSDAQIGAAVREVHANCRRTI